MEKAEGKEIGKRPSSGTGGARETRACLGRGGADAALPGECPGEPWVVWSARLCSSKLHTSLLVSSYSLDLINRECSLNTTGGVHCEGRRTW